MLSCSALFSVPILREKLIKDKKFSCSKCNTAVYIARFSDKKTGVIHKNETTPVKNQTSHLSADDRIHAVVMRHPAAVILKDHFVDLFDFPVGEISKQFT